MGKLARVLFSFICISSVLIARPLAFQGVFYPSEPQKLQRKIRSLLDQAGGGSWSKPHLIIVPHDRLELSGDVAAAAYTLLQGHSYEVVILLGPYHAEMIRGVSVSQESHWSSPMGSFPVALALTHQLVSSFSGPIHASKLHNREHSLEAQLPFLSVILPGTPLLPILISHNDDARALAEALLPLIQAHDVLIICSTDLSHFHPLKDADVIDGVTIERISQGEPADLYQAVENRQAELCGSAGVLTGLYISQAMGWGSPQWLQWGSNFEVKKDPTSVVGYSSFVVY